MKDDFKAANGNEDLGNLVVLFDYLRAQEYWRYVLSLSFESWTFTDLYKAFHSDQLPTWFTKEVDALSTIIENGNLDSPENMNSMLNKIINACELQNCLYTYFDPQWYLRVC